MNGFRGEILGTLKTIAAGVGISLLALCVGCGVVALPIAAPSISQVLPRTITAGSQSVTLKVVGSNFADSVILWNGQTLPTSMVDSSTLAASVQSSSIATPGVVALTVHSKQTGKDSNSVPVMVSLPGNTTTANVPAITTTSLPSATVGTAYSSGLSASGGTPGYTWNITSGQLPVGLTLATSSGAISGTPTASGTFSFGVTVSDSGSPAQSATATLTMSVNGSARSTPAPLAIASTALPGATAGQSYTGALSATGGTAPYAWSITGGRLPGGLSISSGGMIGGTPATSGAFSFTVTVSDASNPALTASATMSITVAASAGSTTNPLAISSSSLPWATDGTAYSAAMQATGGTPAYTWSISSGSLPAGLTLAATTGVISGTPTSTGTSSFTVTVSDNSSPALTQSVATSISVSADTAAPTGPGTTWYIRPDGGTRYDANMPNGQCDGKADVAYPGTGTNQHCAFKDYRFLYDDQSYQNHAWVISGGDTVIIRGGPWRVGVDQGTDPHTVWCNGSGDPYNCTNPKIPAGTPTQHTRILGENYASCNQGNMTQLHGGYGLYVTLSMQGAQYVDVQCIELTRYSQCAIFGVPAVAGNCNSGYPDIDDYAKNGINTDVNTHDVLLQDMWIHGFPSRGIIGPIGGLVTAERVDIAYNGGAGWDFDDGSGSNAGNGTASVNGTWNFKDSIIEWSGCNQQYPGTAALSCYGQSNGGYGDGVGTPPGTCFNVNVDHSIFRYNTQDGLDLLHMNTGTCSLTVTNSQSYGNNGQQFKWGPAASPVIFTNNTAVANCRRLSAPMTGQPAGYNQYLGDFCRAYDAFAIDIGPGANVLMADNTIITYAPTTFDMGCGYGEDCSNSTFTFENNIVMGYANPAYDYGGTSGPGLFYLENSVGHIIRSNNLYYGIGHGFSCPTGNPNEQCGSPQFVNQPIFTDEQSLDNFNFHLTNGSPAIGSGLSLSGITLDFSGATRANPPAIGAFEYQ